MKKTLLILLSLAILIPACGASATTSQPAATPIQAQTVIANEAPPAAVSEAALPSAEAPTTAPTDPAPAPIAIKTDFTPTDPSTVNLALGRPQLVEFYAVW